MTDAQHLIVGLAVSAGVIIMYVGLIAFLIKHHN